MARFDRCHRCEHARDRHHPHGCYARGCDCAGFTRESRRPTAELVAPGLRRAERRPPRLPRDEPGSVQPA